MSWESKPLGSGTYFVWVSGFGFDLYGGARSLMEDLRPTYSPGYSEPAEFVFPGNLCKLNLDSRAVELQLWHIAKNLRAAAFVPWESKTAISVFLTKHSSNCDLPPWVWGTLGI